MSQEQSNALLQPSCNDGLSPTPTLSPDDQEKVVRKRKPYKLRKRKPKVKPPKRPRCGRPPLDGDYHSQKTVILNTKVRPSVRAQIQQIATTQYGISPSCLMRLLLSCYLKDQKLRMLFDASIASRAYLLESYHKYLT